MTIAITTTTISPLKNFLKAYTDNIIKYDHVKEVTIYIAGDCKSQTDSHEAVESFKKQGFQLKYLDIEWQRDYLQRFPDLKSLIPENSDNRRNVAYLLALEEGADVFISVDDDNYPLSNEDFVGQHLSIGKVVEAPLAVGQDHWFNLCSLLNPEVPDGRLYPRGFPYNRRTSGTNSIVGSSSGKIGVNVGLWLVDPDTDAIGRLYGKPVIKERGNPSDVMLANDTFCPINTQNTALSRQAMAAYYYVQMGEDIKGMKLDRFGDIFSGYFVQICAKAVGDHILIGSPLSEHRRNPHNLFIDLYNELAGIIMLEDLVSFFETIDLPTESYNKAYKTLSLELENFAQSAEGFIWEPETRKYIQKICFNMRVWADVVDYLG